MPNEAERSVETIEHSRYLEVRLTGLFSVDWFNQQVVAAVEACRKGGRSLLLLDVTGVSSDLTMNDRFEIAEHGARAAVKIKVALVAFPELIDPRKFGVTVARNRGLDVDVFTDRSEALRWLLTPTRKSP